MSITDQIRAFVRDQRARLDNEPTLDALAVLERDVQPKALKFLRDAEALQRKYRDDATAYSAHVGDDLREAFDELARFVGELRGEGKAFAQCIERQASVNRERGASDAPSGTRGVRAPWLPTLSEYQSKAMSVGSDPDGGYLVPRPIGELVDRLRPASVLLASGVRVIPMESATLDLPKLGTSTTIYRVGEGGTVGASSPTLQLVTLRARAFAARAIGSVEWFSDAQIDARRLLGDDMDKELASAWESDAFNGYTTVLGIKNWTGVTVTEVDAGSGNGGAPALADILDAIGRLEAANATPSAIYMHPTVWAYIRKIEDLQNRLQLTPNPSAEAARRLFGLPVYVTSLLSTTETFGSSTDCSSIIVADTSRIAIGMRQGSRVLYDPFSAAASRQITIHADLRAAVAVLDAAGVEVIGGVRV